MKKYLYGIILVFCFFIFSFDLNAADNNIFDVNMSDGVLPVANPLPWQSITYFNYFQEKKENTDFYKFLDYAGTDIYSYLKTLIGKKPITDMSHYTLVYSVDELIYFNSINENKLSIPEGTTHGIVIVENLPLTFYNSDNTLKIKTSSNFSGFSVNAYIFYFNGFDYLSYDYSSHISKPGVLESMTDTFRALIGFLEVYDFSYNWLSSGWWIFGSETYEGTDFSLLYSKIYESDKSYNYESKKGATLNIQYYCSNNSCKNIDDVSSKESLDYLKKYPIISINYGFLPLLNMLNYYQNKIPYPDGYSKANFDQASNVSLFPIKACEVQDYGLYIYSNSNKSVTLYLHGISSDDKLQYQSSYYTNYKMISNSYITVNPLRKLFGTINNNLVTLSDEDFIKYSYRFQASDSKNLYNVFYNPECYTVSENYEEITFKNPQTGNDITYNGTDLTRTEWSDPENIGTGNSVDFMDISTTKDIINNSKNGLGTIYNAASEIVSLSSDLFSALPNEIQSLLMIIFVIGIALIVIKLVSMFI